MKNLYWCTKRCRIITKLATQISRVQKMNNIQYIWLPFLWSWLGLWNLCKKFGKICFGKSKICILAHFYIFFLLQICKMLFKVNKYFWWYSIVCLFGTRIYFQFKKQCVTNVFDRFSLVNLPTWCMTNLEVIEVCGPRVFWSRNTREYLTTVGSRYNDFFRL